MDVEFCNLEIVCVVETLPCEAMHMLCMHACGCRATQDGPVWLFVALEIYVFMRTAPAARRQ